MKAHQSPQATAFPLDMNTQFDFPSFVYISKDTALLLYTNFIICELEWGAQPLLLFHGQEIQNGMLGATLAAAKLFVQSQMRWLEQLELSYIVDGSVQWFGKRFGKFLWK